MSKKEKFIAEIEESVTCGKIELSEEAYEYFLSLGKSEGKITETGIKILTCMKEDPEETRFSAKVLGEKLFMSGRSISCAMRKLVSDGYCEKEGKDPVYYMITDLGRNAV